MSIGLDVSPYYQAIIFCTSLAIADADMLAGSIVPNCSQAFCLFRVLLGKLRYLNSVQKPLLGVWQNLSSNTLPIAYIDICPRGER
jgi:hypothetical protein